MEVTVITIITSTNLLLTTRPPPPSSASTAISSSSTSSLQLWRGCGRWSGSWTLLTLEPAKTRRWLLSVLLGTFLGVLSDSIGHKKVCLLFCILHLAVGVWRRLASQSSMWLASVCLPLATSIFSCSFEAGLVVEHERQGYRQEALYETFWLMTFVESVALVGSQVLANLLVGSDFGRGRGPFSNVAILVAVVGIVYLGKGWKQGPRMVETKAYGVSYVHLLRDKRLLLLGLAHTCLHFSIAIFWILWAPTLVADGREVDLGLVYPCLLGSRMLGSTVLQWLLSGPSSPRIEDCLAGAFVVLGIVLSIDYQEIGVLVSLFCLFHAGVGLILPSLARLRTIHVPSNLRGGMISLSLTPGNAVILFLLIQRGYYQNIGNSTMLALAAIALFVAAGCMHLLKRWEMSCTIAGTSSDLFVSWSLPYACASPTMCVTRETSTMPSQIQSTEKVCQQGDPMASDYQKTVIM